MSPIVGIDLRGCKTREDAIRKAVKENPNATAGMIARILWNAGLLAVSVQQIVIVKMRKT